MLERFTRDARAAVARAQDEARGLGSPTVEAEHLLLALARDSGDPAGRVLVRRGLDHGRVREALALEVERSLAAVGVSAAIDPDPREDEGDRRFGASAKRALERAVKAAVRRGDRRLVSGHLLLGVLAAEVGTVPRALAAAGVDRTALAAAVEAEISA